MTANEDITRNTEKLRALVLERGGRIERLERALRRLSFAAQTTGGTAGRDGELVAAIAQADEALAQHSEPGRVPERKDDSDAPPYFDIAESLAWASGWNACRNEIDALSASPAVPKAEELARCFHETYECLAPQYGYETRKETREFDSDSKNGRLMIEVCRVIRERFAAPAPDADEGGVSYGL